MEAESENQVWIIVGSVIAGVVAFVVFVYFLREYMQGGKYKKDNRIDGKIVIITGANTGIGKETALDLARRGAKIYMACRDMNRCETARKEIVEITQNPNIFAMELDLASLESVRNFAKKFHEKETKLDILINNAGVMVCPHSLTKDGFETQIGVNHLGHFLLTNLLLDLIKAAAPSRIVVVSSLAHLQGSINKEDLMSTKSYNKITAYCQSKLANVLFTRYLAKQLSGTNVTINALHPGAVRTELTRHISNFLMILSKPFLWVFFKTPYNGAQTQIRLAIDPELQDVSGKYFADCKEKATSAKGRDDAMAEWLWKESERLVGLVKTENQV